MPVEFLTDEQAAAYGRFVETPSRVYLDRLCFLDDDGRTLIAGRRGDVSRLGFALQLVTVRSLGLCLPDPLAVPISVLDSVAEQLQIADPSCVKGYLERRSTQFEHASEIARASGYGDFASVEGELRRWLSDLAWTTGDGWRRRLRHWPDMTISGARRRCWRRPGAASLPGPDQHYAPCTYRRATTQGTRRGTHDLAAHHHHCDCVGDGIECHPPAALGVADAAQLAVTDRPVIEGEVEIVTPVLACFSDAHVDRPVSGCQRTAERAVGASRSRCSGPAASGSRPATAAW
ncbi:MAG: hypothetical protein DLM59_14675 [Pseudonocardiales bacterium]|nr:MAG: hypothetical protein DLM59_14675 [Pseudonocardiales bacterium]